MTGLRTIVVGGLNTDILAVGTPRIVGKGELAYGGTLAIAAGGKSRNIAQMSAALLGPGTVAMVGKTARDPYGLWRVPVEALEAAGVDTRHVEVLPEGSGHLPGVALIPVDTQGNNQIYVVPGVNATFSPGDVDRADALFAEAAEREGTVLLTLECPYPTVAHVIRKAAALRLRVLLDPGGMEESTDIGALLASGVYLFKPNMHEARMATGIAVTDAASAREAASALRARGAEHVLITAGKDGAYLFGEDTEEHIPAGAAPPAGAVKDETGCGDQTLAAFSAALLAGSDVPHAARAAVVAGTLQYGRAGVQPVTAHELAAALAEG